MSKNQTISRDNLKAIHNVACNGWKSKLEDYAKRNPFENEISLSQPEIDDMFKSSDSKQIAVLKKFFSVPTDIRDRVKSFLDACEILKIDHRIVYSSSDSKDEVAFKKLKVIIKALNEGWWPNWENESEYKYWNWFRMKGGFSFYDTNFYNANTFVPSALCLRSNDLAVHASKIAINEYKDYYCS